MHDLLPTVVVASECGVSWGRSCRIVLLIQVVNVRHRAFPFNYWSPPSTACLDLSVHRGMKFVVVDGALEQLTSRERVAPNSPDETSPHETM